MKRKMFYISFWIEEVDLTKRISLGKPHSLTGFFLYTKGHGKKQLKKQIDLMVIQCMEGSLEDSGIMKRTVSHETKRNKK